MQSLDGALYLNCFHLIFLPMAQGQILTDAVLQIRLTHVLQIHQTREISIISSAAPEPGPTADYHKGQQQA